jgi:hypothetical protein
MTRTLLRVAGVLCARGARRAVHRASTAPHAPDQHARPAYGHTTNEFLMMGRNCGASMASG